LEKVKNSTNPRITFGVSLPVEDVTFDQLKGIAQLSEKLGYDSIWSYDHLFPYSDSQAKNKPFFECLMTLSALSMATSKIRLGSLVICNPLRNPALLAKMSSQLDVMSKGRLELGIGAGWFKDEFDAYGYDFPDENTRLLQLEEALQVIRALWTNDFATFEGKFYKVRNAPCEPKPIQKPHPPIWVAGSLKRILRIAAKYADGWNLGFYKSNTPEGFRAKNKMLDQACAAPGRDPSKVRRSWHGLLILGKSESDLEEKEKKYKTLSLGYPPIATTIEECYETLSKFTDAGVTDFVIRFADITEDQSSLETFSNRIIPLFADKDDS
jgi:F420-dependent oxidoreductase-like protein